MSTFLLGFFSSNLISYLSAKQKVVSRSSTESKYRALANGTTKIVWVESILSELRVPISTPPLLLCDNISTTYLTADPIMHAHTKHVEID